MPQLQQAGVRPVAISVDTPEESQDLRRKAGYTYTFLSDANMDAIRRYDLVHRGGNTQTGQDISRPAEFLVDASGTVRWVNLTDDLRVRARPEQMLEEARQLK